MSASVVSRYTLSSDVAVVAKMFVFMLDHGEEVVELNDFKKNWLCYKIINYSDESLNYESRRKITFVM